MIMSLSLVIDKPNVRSLLEPHPLVYLLSSLSLQVFSLTNLASINPHYNDN
jgi:hypothetical protein